MTIAEVPELASWEEVGDQSSEEGFQKSEAGSQQPDFILRLTQPPSPHTESESEI